MRETIVESVKALISPKFIKVQHFKHYMINVYTKKGTAYIMRTFIFNETQYKVSIGCSTIWRKYGIIIGKLRMFIFVAIEME